MSNGQDDGEVEGKEKKNSNHTRGEWEIKEAGEVEGKEK